MVLVDEGAHCFHYKLAQQNFFHDFSSPLKIQLFKINLTEVLTVFLCYLDKKKRRRDEDYKIADVMSKEVNYCLTFCVFLDICHSLSCSHWFYLLLFSRK